MTSGAEPPPDAGLQTERTALAWLRSCLSVLVASVALARLAAHASIPLAVVITVTCLPLAVLVSVLAGARYRRTAVLFRRARPIGDGLLPAGVTLLVALLGLAGIGYVLHA
ncbi:MAG: DUF202 domain-containing protein [Pseudonocardiaceae bacterium]|nr:DUF202 domain-containing protein [Pseudonocardiaceae bacterium]